MRKIDGLLNEHKKKVLKRLSLSPALQVLGRPGQEVSGAQRSGVEETRTCCPLQWPSEHPEGAGIGTVGLGQEKS